MLTPITKISKLGLKTVLISAVAGCTVANTEDLPLKAAKGPLTISTSLAQIDSTVMDEPLQCLANLIHDHSTNIYTVGQIRDMTGQTADTTRPSMSEGASLMAMKALSKLGVSQVERFDTSISEVELEYANQKLILDAAEEKNYRKIHAGSIIGSDFYIVGGITEINFNVSSSALEYRVGPGLGAVREYTITVAADLRLVNTITSETLQTVSVRKQVKGKETQKGLATIIRIYGLGTNERIRVQEPLQEAIRQVIERAVFDLISNQKKVKANDCLPVNKETTKEPTKDT